uniref:Uncharacterized protein n=1 Tax=Neisseria meningitidis alpha522 TaxID=996307 RepID=I4E7Y7_NEIME|nr:hypothetical protein NMALPHA522_1914 [Neisseria meningitidis alpha522]
MIDACFDWVGIVQVSKLSKIKLSNRRESLWA